MRSLDLRIRDHVSISDGTFWFSTESEHKMAFIIFFFFLKKLKKVEKTGITSTKFSLRCTLSVILGFWMYNLILKSWTDSSAQKGGLKASKHNKNKIFHYMEIRSIHNVDHQSYAIIIFVQYCSIIIRIIPTLHNRYIYI